MSRKDNTSALRNVSKNKSPESPVTPIYPVGTILEAKLEDQKDLQESYRLMKRAEAAYIQKVREGMQNLGLSPDDPGIGGWEYDAGTMYYKRTR